MVSKRFCFRRQETKHQRSKMNKRVLKATPEEKKDVSYLSTNKS